ncbi:MAG: alkaline phosphatase family protein, partial [Clostridia bacterium]|nr:alkaline phosphatase family protein [Clostridia bacterium]
WEELRDLTRPNHLHTSMCINLHYNENTDEKITDAAIDYIRREEPDFLFLYLGDTDEAGGHSQGWMSEGYLDVVKKAWACIERVYRALPEGYTLITTADHGGHGRSHGSDMDEDMLIPICFCGPDFAPDTAIEGVSIKDIPTTIAALLGVPAVKEWEGKIVGK